MYKWNQTASVLVFIVPVPRGRDGNEFQVHNNNSGLIGFFDKNNTVFYGKAWGKVKGISIRPNRREVQVVVEKDQPGFWMTPFVGKSTVGIDPQAAFELGRFNQRIGDYADAIDYFTISANARYVPALAHLFNICMGKSQYGAELFIEDCHRIVYPLLNDLPPEMNDSLVKFYIRFNCTNELMHLIREMIQQRADHGKIAEILDAITPALTENRNTPEVNEFLVYLSNQGFNQAGNILSLSTSTERQDEVLNLGYGQFPVEDIPIEEDIEEEHPNAKDRKKSVLKYTLVGIGTCIAVGSLFLLLRRSKH